MGLSFLKNNMFNQVENDIGFYYYNCYHFTFLIKKVTDSIFVEILMVFIIILVSKDGNHQSGKNLYPDIEALSLMLTVPQIFICGVPKPVSNLHFRNTCIRTAPSLTKMFWCCFAFLPNRRRQLRGSCIVYCIR